ncbi:hypothetical protein [Alteraurantiacibacter aquimixticola]|uniref:Lipoprotein n=1 Tax=Alteraurantiacibacter aquimixticola TaxID=2489173 RepID=A0A4T3F1L0_9SPHN|nr:hypothetical protein [Alteraurantiacibacter aquimixticola]TIX51083.1 hypothetical protein E5222_00935 [Alteraurantiacibacter aquimixticola]
MKGNLAPAALALLAACAPVTATAETAGAAPTASATPVIHDELKATMLRENSGVTLQWISWDERGPADVVVAEDGSWHLTASQFAPERPAAVLLDGKVTEVGADYFLFDGTITIMNTPDAGRFCQQDKVWRFAITQDRQYWRLREFEWCDYLTDYIDIYF